ncbi:MAG: hypothetical protein COA44_15125 [Arcobacter sp.]|nr:MAG: hypothetical protein COA44_15125 [Arcobacter sp.]
MKCNEELLYIEDANKKRLYYRFTPAAVASNFVPLIVILHDEKSTQAPHFEYKMWNVLTPIDNFEYENKGACWLGEKGDFFVKDLLQELISKIVEEYECEEHIYLYGSGMGGYGAIVHGILCKANAIYVKATRIRLEEMTSKESDLSNFLNPSDSFPIFYICGNEGPLKSEIEQFIDRCKQNKIKFHLDRCIKSEDNEMETIKEILKMFERMISQT